MCSDPQLSIEQSYPLTQPKTIYRSQQITLSTLASFACNSTYTLRKAWSLIKLDENANYNSISLSSNPTSLTSMLVIEENILDYGLYMFSFDLALSITTTEEEASNMLYIRSSNVSTFIRVIQTGIGVYALENGISNVRIGYMQMLVLNPGVYSKDFDQFVSTQTLSFVFYCRCRRRVNNELQDGTQMDLQTLWSSPTNAAISWNETCFKSKGRILFFISDA